MKIKRLTAGLAVAAMAATFFAAAPILSAQAATVTSTIGIDVSTTPASGSPLVLDAGPVSSTSPLSFNVWQALVDYSQPTGVTALGTGTWVDTTSPVNIYSMLIDQIYNGTPGLPGGVAGSNLVTGWKCVSATVVDPNLKPYAAGDTNHGTASCSGAMTDTYPSTTNLTYNPGNFMGNNGDARAYIQYNLVPTFATPRPANAMQDIIITGYVFVTVQKPALTGCDASQAVNLKATIQAYGKGDDATSAKFDLVKSNVASNTNTKGAIKYPDTAAMWGLESFNSGDSTDPYFAWNAQSLLKQAGNTVTFTPPQDWSGVVTYIYDIAKYDSTSATPVFLDTPDAKGCVVITVQPTLTAPDQLTTDQGVAVTIPLLGQGSLKIIGTKDFTNANCVFVSTGKIKDSAVGSILNKGKDKNPIFTPNADFVGSVDLSCTVEDAIGTTSNAVTVTIQVGAVPAPASVVPACTTNCDSNGKLVSTGGSLATPMGSGLVALVLLVAAGAGILVVRRRTALAG